MTQKKIIDSLLETYELRLEHSIWCLEHSKRTFESALDLMTRERENIRETLHYLYTAGLISVSNWTSALDKASDLYEVYRDRLFNTGI